MTITAERVVCDCGGLLDLIQVSDAPPLADPALPLASTGYRYSAELPCRLEDLLQVSLGADMVTPLLAHHRNSEVWLKCDNLLPTGSFKDRGASVLVAMALQHGIERLVVDSSGNAGTAIAAHAARAGIECDVFVPSTTSPEKIRQAVAMGANVRLVPGTRAETQKAAAAAAFSEGSFYASHIFNPHFHHGVKTWAYEVCDQLGQAPRTVVLPVGNGSLLLGIALGFEELLDRGRIQQLPRIVAVQSEACQTLSDGYVHVPVSRTTRPIAEGIATDDPARRNQMRSVLNKTKGSAVFVSDAQILSAQKDLGLQGFYIEPTGSVGWAGYQSIAKTEELSSPVVVALTGSGLKTSLT